MSIEIRPRITVVVPTFNSASFVERGLQSIVDQSYAPDHVIVSDDGSTDSTAAVVKRFADLNPHLNWQLVRNRHKGPGAARNAGIQAATTEWLAFLDSDDYWRPEKLDVVVQRIKGAPTANFFCHNQENIKLDGTSEILDYCSRVNTASPIGRQLLWDNLFTPSAVVCHRSLVVQVGGFDEMFMSAQDYELWLRMAPALRVVMINGALGVYVQRPGSISSSYSAKYLHNCVRILYRHRHLGPPGLAILSALRILAYFTWGKFKGWWASSRT